MFGLSISIGLASLWSEKARLWIRGRKQIFERMEQNIDPSIGPIVWMHCASLGEFEQGRTVLEHFKIEHPSYRILLTFFSPSGYEVRKNTSLADWVFYLPLDGKRNANRFLDIVQPQMAIFVKYESWFHYLYALRKRGVPSILISAFFRKEQNFFGIMGGLLRKMLDLYDFIYVQDKISADLLNQYAVKAPHAVAGDTRFDRVCELAAMDAYHPHIERFIGNQNVVVAGSTWNEDEELLRALHLENKELKFIIAPHEINESHLAELKVKFKNVLFLSELENGKNIGEEKILVIDCFGLLSKLYRYGTICYVGGGFNKSGIHNILEAAVYGKIVFFGPNHKRTAEAGELIRIGAGVSVTHSNEFVTEIQQLIIDEPTRLTLEKKSFDYVYSNRGATVQILAHVSKILNSLY